MSSLGREIIAFKKQKYKDKQTEKFFNREPAYYARNRKTRKAKQTQQDAMAMQQLKNEGALAVQDRAETGSTNRFGTGDKFNRAKLASTDKIADRKFGLEQETEKFKQFSSLQDKSIGEIDPATGDVIPGISMEQSRSDFSAFKNDPEGTGAQISSKALAEIEGQRQDTVTRATGIQEVYDKDGNLVPETTAEGGRPPTGGPPTGGSGPGGRGRPGPTPPPAPKPFGYDFINSRGGYLSGLKGASMMSETFNRNLMSAYKGVESAYDWLKQPAVKRK